MKMLKWMSGLHLEIECETSIYKKGLERVSLDDLVIIKCRPSDGSVRRVNVLDPTYVQKNIGRPKKTRRPQIDRETEACKPRVHHCKRVQRPTKLLQQMPPKQPTNLTNGARRKIQVEWNLRREERGIEERGKKPEKKEDKLASFPRGEGEWNKLSSFSKEETLRTLIFKLNTKQPKDKKDPKASVDLPTTAKSKQTK
ncbi:hypothetical protein IEQ34_002338 [Dendrobium chrysotoxum]|uniref:Uncharacterized protein n=1 Tax=Dendrobium chrysotoxum TaxID=161865 RepID=A0AAV7HJH8_DENCH|nr:hypothetical protein IEQ34_002338 [Dendrobium chrysotoxum]